MDVQHPEMMMGLYMEIQGINSIPSLITLITVFLLCSAGTTCALKLLHAWVWRLAAIPACGKTEPLLR
jgi:hypothetical protein